VQLLHEVRFADLSAQRVAEAAGISRTSLYFYFESMHDLLAAVIGRALTEMIDSIEALGDVPSSSPVETLAAGLRVTCDTWRQHGPIQKTAVDYAHSIPAVHQHWRMLLDRGITLYVALMQWAASDAGRPPPAEPVARRHAELFMYMVGQAFYELFETPHTDDDEDQLIQDLLIMGTRALELER
jgi:AcrR family transcriptional regulator